MENEENRGLIHKKVYEDQLVTFFQFNVGAMSLFPLSHTLGYLEFFLGALRNWSKKGK